MNTTNTPRIIYQKSSNGSFISDMSYYERHKDHIIKYQIKYRREHKEQARAYGKAYFPGWYAENKCKNAVKYWDLRRRKENAIEERKRKAEETARKLKMKLERKEARRKERERLKGCIILHFG